MTRPTHGAPRQPRLQRVGRVVLRHGQPVVTFGAPCGAPAGSPPGACSGCTAGGGREVPLAGLDGAAGARPGDRMMLEVSASGLTRIALHVFALPLAALMLGAWLVRVAPVFPPESADLASGLFGLVCLAITVSVVARDGSRLVGMMGLTARRLRTDR